MAKQSNGIHLGEVRLGVQPGAPCSLLPPASQKAATLLIATPHEIAGAGIEALLQTSGHSVVARCSREDDLLRRSEAHYPDIIMLSDSIVAQDFATTMGRLRSRNHVGIIFLIEQRDAFTVANLLDLNVDGIVLSASSARSLIDCVQCVAQGRKWIDPDLLRHIAIAERHPQVAYGLTSRECEIAQLVSRGMRNKEIARQLHLSEGTVKMHLHHIYKKLDFDGRAQLMLSMAEAPARMPRSGVAVSRTPGAVERTSAGVANTAAFQLKIIS